MRLQRPASRRDHTLEGKVVLITGAAHGIGAAVARRVSARGARVTSSPAAASTTPAVAAARLGWGGATKAATLKPTIKSGSGMMTISAHPMRVCSNRRRPRNDRMPPTVTAAPRRNAAAETTARSVRTR